MWKKNRRVTLPAAFDFKSVILTISLAIHATHGMSQFKTNTLRSNSENIPISAAILWTCHSTFVRSLIITTNEAEAKANTYTKLKKKIYKFCEL